jgi:hypothetical protein
VFIQSFVKKVIVFKICNATRFSAHVNKYTSFLVLDENMVKILYYLPDNILHLDY